MWGVENASLMERERFEEEFLRSSLEKHGPSLTRQPFHIRIILCETNNVSGT